MELNSIFCNKLYGKIILKGTHTHTHTQIYTLETNKTLLINYTSIKNIWQWHYMNFILSPGGVNGSALQYSCLENFMDRRDRWTAVHRVIKNQTRLSTPAAAAGKSLQSCPTLSDPMDCSPPGSSIHGIFQARVLEWVAIAFSGAPLHTPYLNFNNL